MEKTPANLLMTRFLQAAFPNSYFVVVRRHPVAVSMANQRWKKSMASLHMGFEHWLRCHELFEEDKEHLERVYELTYEDYIADPSRYHHEIADFIGTRVMNEDMEEVTGSHNRRYFDRWTKLLANSPFRSYYRYIARKYAARFEPYGYSLTSMIADRDEVCGTENEISDRTGALYCRGADAHAFLWRLAERSKGSARRTLRKCVPKYLQGQAQADFATRCRTGAEECRLMRRVRVAPFLAKLIATWNYDGVF